MKKLIFVLLMASPALAEAPVVENVQVQAVSGAWRFNVTLAHPDTGWDHYADGWRVETEDGSVLGTRELLHPHVDEQPFTRSLSGVSIPTGISTVFVRAKCSVDGWADTTVPVSLN
ncbi:hypothetical protein Q8W25_17035 [Shimia thalassica]|uniref:hypothetical protein n=1 Tax=Shimia thalassica TaxID=1715693 RepID=UPI002495140B|nr:hypothetical protein [Shimia thalassica]MDO6479679.1 hypothetical protein [Shimia thalassica]MDP2495739.1 hypothetical protein [Shimia thalassica]MDP2519936.1 hypothetical protein [Shimia thalassica]